MVVIVYFSCFVRSFVYFQIFFSGLNSYVTVLLTEGDRLHFILIYEYNIRNIIVLPIYMMHMNEMYNLSIPVSLLIDCNRRPS